MSNEEQEYQEQEYLNELTRPGRERYCRRAHRIDMAVRWGGWLVAGMILVANIAVWVF